METKDKELLLKDLSARLPYGVKGQAKGMIKFFGDEEVSEEPWTLTSINVQLNTFGADTQTGVPLFNRRTGICNFKPYLFPMSSMTEEQCEELYAISEVQLTFTPDIRIKVYKNTIEWFLKNHIDYNGLIEKGLAIDATGLEIY